VDFFGDFRELSEERTFEDLGLSAEAGVTYSNPVCGDEVCVCVELCSDTIASFTYRARGCWPVFGCLEFLGKRFLQEPAVSAATYPLLDFLSEVEGIPTSKRHAFSLAHRGLVGAVSKAWAEAHKSTSTRVGPPGKERV